MASCIVDTPDVLRALGMVDALHVVLGFGTNRGNDWPTWPDEEFFLRPFAIVELVKTGKGKKEIPYPFSAPSLLMFTAYRVTEPHNVASLILRKMGIKDDLILMGYFNEVVARRKWRGKVVIKKQLYEHVYNCGNNDDGYLKTLRELAVGEGEEVPPDWEVMLMTWLLFIYFSSNYLLPRPDAPVFETKSSRNGTIK